MVDTPAGISEADWLGWPALAREFILVQQGELQAQKEEIEQLRLQLTALASELAQLRERIGRSSRNSSKPLSNDGPGFKPSERRKGTGRKRGGQPGHSGSGPELLPIERVDEVVEHHPVSSDTRFWSSNGVDAGHKEELQLLYAAGIGANRRHLPKKHTRPSGISAHSSGCDQLVTKSFGTPL